MWRTGGCAVHSSVRRTPLFRLIALVVALLGSLSAPTLALAHAHVHEHLAQRHGGDAPANHDDDPHGDQPGDQPGDQHRDHHGDHHTDAGDASGSRAAAWRSSSSDHAHGHPRLDVVQGTRDLIRLPAAHESAPLVPAVVTLRATLHEVRAPARTDRVLLARPDPERGPPPTLRAPPTS